VEAPSRAALMLGGRLEGAPAPVAAGARPAQSVDGFELK